MDNSTAKFVVPRLRHGAVSRYPRSYMAARLWRGLPAQIKQLRRERGWTQAQLAAAMDISQNRLALIEKARPGRYLSLGTLLRAAEALGMALIVEFRPVEQFMAELAQERAYHDHGPEPDPE